MHGHVKCVQILLSYGAKIDIPNILNEMPVDCIGICKNANVVYDLIKIRGYVDSYSEMMMITENSDLS